MKLASDRPVILTHRGFGKLGPVPENSMEAFSASLQKGFSGHELDVRLTRDGIPVIFHGPDLSTTTEANGYVENLTLAELRQYNCAHYLGKSWKEKCRIPTLDEYLTKYGKEIYTNIEIKKEWYKTGFRLERKVMEAVEKHGCRDNILVSSFNLGAIHFIKKNYPGIKVGMLVDKHRIPWIWIPAILLFLKPDNVHMHNTMASPGWIAYIQKKKSGIALWAVNKQEELEKFRKLGVNIIITDNMDFGSLSRDYRKANR